MLIVDDLVQTGGTLYEAGKVEVLVDRTSRSLSLSIQALQQQGALTVSAFCAHGVFPDSSWQRFARGGDRAIFERFFITNSIPKTANVLPTDDVFQVLDLTPQLLEDLA